MTDGKDPKDGITEEPTSDNSNAKGTQSSETDSDMVKRLDKLQKQFDALARATQSGKDKGIKQVSQRVELLETDLRAVLQAAQAGGKNISDVLSELKEQEDQETRQVVREMAIAFKSGQFPGSLSRGSDEDSGIDVSAVLIELELDESDPAVKVFRSKSYKSEAEAYREAAKLLTSKIKHQPSDADRPGEVSRRQQAPDKTSALMEEYKEGSKNLRGMPLIKFKQAMRAKGLDIS